ncbi:hypothetical protein ACWEN6_13505 [Sphaerisporangium sp. NPDC004334]
MEDDTDRITVERIPEGLFEGMPTVGDLLADPAVYGSIRGMNDAP